MLALSLSGFFVDQNSQITENVSQVSVDSEEGNEELPASPPQISTTSFLPPPPKPQPHPQPNPDYLEKKEEITNKFHKALFSFALPAIKKIGDNIFNRLDNLVTRMKDKSEGHKEKLKRCLLNFENFKSKFRKNFKSEDSESHGLENFEQNLDFVETCNKKTKHSYKLELNEYADLAWEEFQDRFLMKVTDQFKDNNHLIKNLRDNGSRASFFKAKAPTVGSDFTEYSHRRLLQSVNPVQFARSIGVATSVSHLQYITPVKNQRRCNSCYAFAGIGALEAAIAKKYGSTSILSEQEQVDCSTWDVGCSGGDPFNSFMYHMYYGTAKNDVYPYVALAGTCKYLDYDKKVFTPLNAEYISGDVASFLQALEKGPVAIIHEVNKEFSLYSTGVYTKQTCGTQLNHSAVAYGYDLNDPIPHILVKNAWGPNWGSSGHYKLAIGPLSGANRGTCGFLSHDYTSRPYYPY